jgi:hypothetical protein
MDTMVAIHLQQSLAACTAVSDVREGERSPGSLRSCRHRNCRDRRKPEPAVGPLRHFRQAEGPIPDHEPGAEPKLKWLFRGSDHAATR